jgi:ubiquinone/menaquinone biosynthesis C-methylase UbiE
LSQEIPKKEHPSTYWVQGRANEEEAIRLHIQGQMLTASMGGALPEQPHPISIESVLDVGCGTGDWLLETAKTYPTISLLMGTDISKNIISYANMLAEEQGLADRVQFRVMDALGRFDFPDDAFDLVNQRLGASYLRTWDWTGLLHEFRRVTRSGGIVRITECCLPESNSPALASLYAIMQEALSRAGHHFTPGDKNGVLHDIPPLLEQHGFTQIQSYIHRLEYRAGTFEGRSFHESQMQMFRMLLPFFRQWCRVPDNYQEIYQQAVSELQQPDFVVTWTMITAWGVNNK